MKFQTILSSSRFLISLTSLIWALSWVCMISVNATWINLNNFHDLDVYIVNSGENIHYTLMDRNLWASEYYWESNNVWNSYGAKYQWGNNFSFFINSKDWTTTSWQVDASKYGPWNYYNKNEFVKAHPWDSSNNKNLRWGEWDTLRGNWSWNSFNRQGPCPDGYYIPSVYSRWEIFQPFGHNDNTDENYLNIKSIWLVPNNYLLLPLAWGAFYDKKYSMISVSSEGYDWIYRTSSPNSRYTWYAYNFEIGSYWNYTTNSETANGLSVRCVKIVANNPTISIDTNWWTRALISLQNGNKVVAIWSPKKEGFKFIWRYTNQNFIWEKVKLNDILSNWTTLYAKRWELTVSFDTNWGTIINDVYIEKWWIIKEPIPIKPWYRFDGRFLDKEFSNKFNFSTTITNDITLYAKWIYEYDYDDLNIYFVDWNWDLTQQTTMDRNLGAKEIYNKKYNSTEVNYESFWYHYQRWNNYWFSACNGLNTNSHVCSGFPGNENTYWGEVPIKERLPYIPSKYSNNIWNTSAQWMWILWEWSAPIHNSQSNLWWWLWDSLTGNGVWTSEDRQWPCPDGYHIPSIFEWSNLTKWWENIKWTWCNINHVKDFSYDFLLPPNWYRWRGSAWVYDQWVQWRYWNSSSSSWHFRFNVDSRPNQEINNKIGGFQDNQKQQAIPSEWYAVRCFKNRINTGKFNIESNWWNAFLITIQWNTINSLTDPIKKWCEFDWRYIDTNYSTKIKEWDNIKDWDTLYAKWNWEGCDPINTKWEEVVKEEYWETNSNVSWVVIYNWVKMNTITVSYGNESITILDRNLGATKAWTGKDSYGYYFQWWNNHGFTEKDNITHTYNDHTYKGYGPVNPLDSDLFWWTYFDIWDNSKHFDFIWWWEKDNTSNNYNAWNVKLIENHTSRQWPCPEGFHIPSAGEWSQLLELWGNKNGVYNWKSDEYNLREISSQKWIWEKLSNDLLIPFAWTISVGSWWSVSMSHVWGVGSLWTSSPFIAEDEEDSRKNLSRSMYIYNDGLSLSIDNRSEAQNIRCFKDTKLKTISNYSIFFDTNWWKHINNMTFTPYSNSVTVGHPMEEANGRYVLDLYDIEKYLVPIRTGYEFIGWYSDKWLTNKFDFDTILTNNIVLYAKRSKNISHDTVNGIDTITVYDYSSDKSITIMANNLWVTSNQEVWYLYQWGNNYWFTEKQLETRSTTPIKYENYGPQKPYKSRKYVVSSPNNYYDYWENDAHYPNLRWGEWDTLSNNWNASTEKSLRQWPCPEWFHVPSKGEWDDLINIWSKNNGITWTMSMYWWYPDKPAYNKIVKDLNLWSWYYYRTLWSSSPIEAWKAYYLWIVNDYTISAKYAMSNNSVAQIRCFLNDSIEKDEDNNLWDNLENSNDKDNENKSVKYTVKHLTETLTWAYTLLSTETPTAESWSKVTPPVKKFKGYKSPNTKTITVKWDWTSVVEYRYSRELFEITLNKWEWIQTVAWGGSYRFWTKVSLSATPVPGYEFVGFEGDQTTWSFTMPSNNITITAKAKKGNTKYSISYNLNKWKLEQWKTNPTSYNSSSPSFTINPPVRNEYVFAWWEETVNWKVTWIKTYVSIPQWSTWHRKYSAKWKKEWEVEEMIYNQQEDLEGNYVTVEVIASDWDWDSDSWNWNTNWPREYEWFHLVEDFSKQNNIDQWAIWEVLELWSNWPATIIYRYARNSYTLTIEKDAWIELVQWAWTYKYQEPVSIKVKVKDWYQFAWFEWEYNVANFEMPAKNLTIKAITTKRK